ncbi:MAG: hypothetical protein AAF333_12330 [Planctomycetota bacterium]
MRYGSVAGPGFRGLHDVRIDPRSSLTVQLIQQAEFGPGRFDPQGPRLRLTAHPADRASGEVASRAETNMEPNPVEPKPAPRPADTHRCDARLAQPCPCVGYTVSAASPDVRVVQVVETTVLPAHLTGALLDVLA